MKKIIHQIWIGNEAPEFIKNAMQSVKNYNPDYEYKLWTNEHIDKFDVRKYIDDELPEAHISNIIRIKVLAEYGGWYIDADMSAHDSLNLLPTGFFVGSISEVRKNRLFMPGCFYTDGSISFDVLIDEYNADKAFNGMFNWYLNRERLYKKIVQIPTELVGKNGTVLKDLALKSWHNHPNTQQIGNK